MATVRHLGLFFMEESVSGPFRTLRTPLSNYTPNLVKNILIGGGDMPPKRNSKKRPLAAEFYFRLQL